MLLSFELLNAPHLIIIACQSCHICESRCEAVNCEEFGVVRSVLARYSAALTALAYWDVVRAAVHMSEQPATPRSNGKGKGNGKGGRGKGGRGKGSSKGNSGAEAVDVSDGDSVPAGRGKGATPRGGGGGGKGASRPKPGDTKEMGGIALVAVEKEGQIRWEPVNGIDSVASREAERKAEQEEARWRKTMEAGAKEERVREARNLARQEQQRKAELFGAENVYRTTGKSRGPLVPVPKLLAETREEETQARNLGLDKSNPKQYLFIKESLDALEKKHSVEEHAAREKAYAQNRRRLKLGASDDKGTADGDSDEDGDTLQSRLAKMTDEEFKQLALERKKRAEAELTAAPTDPGRENGGRGDSAMTPRGPNSKGTGGKNGKGGRDYKTDANRGGGTSANPSGESKNKRDNGADGGGGSGRGGRGDKGEAAKVKQLWTPDSQAESAVQHAGRGRGSQSSGRTGRGGPGGRGGRGGRGQQDLDPADDPDYRR